MVNKAVLAEGLTVVARYYEHGFLGEAALVEVSHQAPDLFVNEVDLAVVAGQHLLRRHFGVAFAFGVVIFIEGFHQGIGIDEAHVGGNLLVRFGGEKRAVAFRGLSVRLVGFPVVDEEEEVALTVILQPIDGLVSHLGCPPPLESEARRGDILPPAHEPGTRVEEIADCCSAPTGACQEFLEHGSPGAVGSRALEAENACVYPKAA